MEETRDLQLSMKLFVVLSRAFETIQKQVAKDIRSYGVNPTEFAVLELLYNKGEQPIQKIGEKVLLASSSITYVVDKLEDKAYLKREACAKDRRVTYAVLTEAGRNFMDEIFPKHKKALQKIFSGLTVEEKELARDLLKKLGYYATSL